MAFALAVCASPNFCTLLLGLCIFQVRALRSDDGSSETFTYAVFDQRERQALQGPPGSLVVANPASAGVDAPAKAVPAKVAAKAPHSAKGVSLAPKDSDAPAVVSPSPNVTKEAAEEQRARTRQARIKDLCGTRSCQPVYWAVSQFANALGMATLGMAIHSSLVIGECPKCQEVSYGQNGVWVHEDVSSISDLPSHKNTTGTTVESQWVGSTPYTAKQVESCLEETGQFEADAYNLRSCNCNRATAVAMYMTVGKRLKDVNFDNLNWKPRDLERCLRRSPTLDRLASAVGYKEGKLVKLKDLKEHIETHDECQPE